MTASTEPESKPGLPSISHRVSIRFLPHPASEPTTTIVLNGGGDSSLFTDFRPLLDDPSKCEWAFAGVKRHLEDGRSLWDHLVDNRSVESGQEAAMDIGLCRTLDNGDYVEAGEMLNPATGAVGPYEEVWRDEEVVPGTRIVVLRLQHKDSPDSETRGIFVWIGRWAQGVLREQDAAIARRWRFDDKWEEAAAYGNETHVMPLPNGNSLSATFVEYPDGEYKAGQHWAWVVVEDYTCK